MIYYEVLPRSDVDTDIKPIVDDRRNKLQMTRVIIYCRSLNVCSDLYAYFLSCLGEDSYFPPDAPTISDNRLFGMYHANTPAHNKEVILNSMQKEDGVVRVVFATVALGMGVNLVGVNRVVHYGAPATIDDYFQDSGRAGRSGEAAKSTVYWKPSDAPLRRDTSDPRNVELAAVRHYLENNTNCHRQQLLNYFDSDLFSTIHCNYVVMCVLGM